MTIAKYNYIPVVNDTDSISFCKPDNSPFTEKEQQDLIDEINSIMPDMIEFEHDGYFKTILVIKAKNYVLENQKGELKKKGASITDSKKEPALLEMLDRLIKDLIYNQGKNTIDIYHEYIIEANNIQDITRWSTKVSVTKAVLSPTRTNEEKVLSAIKHREPREGDKFWLYRAIDGEVQEVKKGEKVFFKDGRPKMIPNRIQKCADEWTDNEFLDQDTEHYTKRVYMTLYILVNLLDIGNYVKYHLKGKNQELIELVTPLGQIIYGKI